MKRTNLAFALFLYPLPLFAGDTLVTARQYRDKADAAAIEKLVDGLHADTPDGLLHLAQLELWACEAAHARADNKRIRQAAEKGLRAAEQAVGSICKSRILEELF